MNKVSENIWIGDSQDALKMIVSPSEDLSATLNVARDLSIPIWNPNVNCFHVGLDDGPSMTNELNFPVAVELLKKLDEKGIKTIVFCHTGFCRSPFVVAYYLARKNKTLWKDEFEKIQRIRPNVGLKEWMGKLAFDSGPELLPVVSSNKVLDARGNTSVQANLIKRWTIEEDQKVFVVIAWLNDNETMKMSMEKTNEDAKGHIRNFYLIHGQPI